MPFVLPFTLQHVSPWVTAKISIFAPWNGAFDLGARDFLFANNVCIGPTNFTCYTIFAERNAAVLKIASTLEEYCS